MTGAKVLFESDLDTSILREKQIGIVGYGSQGRAQALNLRDSGFTPQIGVRGGKSREQALADGFAAVEVVQVARACDILMMLVPDEAQPSLCSESIFPNIRPKAFVGFATGFCVHFGMVVPPSGVRFFLTAPKGAGEILRKRFQEGEGIPAMVGSLAGDDEGFAVAMAYAKAIGCGRAGVVRTSFTEEAVADLFGEQCVLVGGLVELMKAAFDTLVARGYSPEVAYIECIQEVEYMAAVISRVGLGALKDKISSTAYYGGATRGSRIIDADTKRRLGLVLDEIEHGEFGREFLEHMKSGARLGWSSQDFAKIEKARSNLRSR